MTDQMMIESAEFGRAKARGGRINFHKIEGSRSLMGGDYVPKCACCRDAMSLWSGATLIEVSLMDALQFFLESDLGSPALRSG